MNRASRTLEDSAARILASQPFGLKGALPARVFACSCVRARVVYARDRGAQIIFARVGVADYDDEESTIPLADSGWGVGVGLPAGSLRARFDFTKTSIYYDEERFGVALEWLL
jgi:hypothetical protein